MKGYWLPKIPVHHELPSGSHKREATRQAIKIHWKESGVLVISAFHLATQHMHSRSYLLNHGMSVQGKKTEQEKQSSGDNNSKCDLYLQTCCLSRVDNKLSWLIFITNPVISIPIPRKIVCLPNSIAKIGSKVLELSGEQHPHPPSIIFASLFHRALEKNYVSPFL